MFRNQKENSALNQNITTLIGNDTVVLGPIKTTSTLRIDGQVNNDIFSESGVILGEKGQIKGNIEAKEVIIYGKIEGNIKANAISIKVGSHVFGNLATQKLAIEPGSTFVGDVHMESSEAHLEPIVQEN